MEASASSTSEVHPSGSPGEVPATAATTSDEGTSNGQAAVTGKSSTSNEGTTKVVTNDFVEPPPAPRRTEPPPSPLPNTYPNNLGYVTPYSGTEMDGDRPPPPPTTPYPKGGIPFGQPPRDGWIQQRVWDALEEKDGFNWVKVRFVSINKELTIPPFPPALPEAGGRVPGEGAEGEEERGQPEH